MKFHKLWCVCGGGGGGGWGLTFPLSIPHFTKQYLTNRRQFSMVFALIDHKMKSEKCSKLKWNQEPQASSFTAKLSFGHFMASFYGVLKYVLRLYCCRLGICVGCKRIFNSFILKQSKAGCTLAFFL